LRLNSKTYLVNGKASTLLAAPYIFKDRTMVPLRMISEEFGATVDWAEKTKTITINKDGKTLVMVIGKTSAYLDVPPVVKNYTTFVPVRYVTEQLGAIVDWNGGSQEIVITD
ncbi:MAG: copper amine oxidase N-terminal domain-containing protein, partial [Clostridia bacterium]